MHWPSFVMGSHAGSLWCPDRCQNHKMACLPEGRSGHKHLGERRFHTTWSRLAERKNTVLNWDLPAAISISTALKPSPWSLSTVTTAIFNNLARQTVQNSCPCRKAHSLWSSNTELIKWEVCLTCGFKNLWQAVPVCGWHANGSPYWLQSAGWLAEFCHGLPGWA